MSDLQFFYVVMGAFYLWECTHWLRTATVPFVTWVGESFRVTHPFFVANSREAGLVFASPVLSIGTLFVSSEWPVAIAPQGVANAAGTHVSFADQPRFTSRRQQLRVEGQPFAKGASRSHVRWLADELNKISSAAEPEREDRVLALLRGAMDSKRIVDRLGEFKQTASLPSGLALALFLFAFMIAPAMIWRFGLAVLWPWLLGGVVLLSIVNAMVFFRGHKRLHPELDDERFGSFLMVLLFPPAAMRTRDLLSRPLLERFHPLALSKELCNANRFKAMAGRAVREGRHPREIGAMSKPGAAEVWQWFNQTKAKEGEEFVAQAGLQPDTFAAAPHRSDPDGKSYCPRCQAQFTRTDGVCSDCGIVLVPFS